MAERPLPPEPPPRATWLTPRYVLPALAVLLLVAIVFTPQRMVGRSGDARLTTHSAEAQGARGLHDALRRLGWRTERRAEPIEGALATDAVYAVLAPPVAPTAAETHRLLEAVRAGASLLWVADGRRSVIGDSLRVRPSRRGGPVSLDTMALRRACGGVSAGGLIDWPGGRPWLFAAVRTGRTASSGADTAFVWVTGTRDGPARERGDTGGAITIAADRAAERMPEEGEPAAIGWTIGRGRVVAVADPDLLRNDVLRTCRWNAGLTVVRMFEWAARRPDGAPLRRVVFDEYHQGFGRHASAVGAARRFLAETAPGRVIFQLAIAALVLLVAAAPRPLAPVPRVSFERRSPLEHVGALSRAYEQVGATRLAARRLARGVRRRHAHGAWRHAPDEEFLQSIPLRYPALAPDVALVLEATRRPLPPEEFVKVGQAIATIERTLHQP